MIADEVMAENHLLKGELGPPKVLDGMVEYSCKFFWEYRLPCRQIFLQHYLALLLTKILRDGRSGGKSMALNFAKESRVR